MSSYTGPLSGPLNVIPLDASALFGSTGPTIDIGNDGEFCLDLNSSLLYGPKDGNNTSYPWPVAGALGQRMSFKGAFSYFATYNPGDVVTDSSSGTSRQYLCVKPVILFPATVTSASPGPWEAGTFVIESSVLYVALNYASSPPSVSSLGAWQQYSPYNDWSLSSNNGLAGPLGNFVELSSTIQADTAGYVSRLQVASSSITANELANEAVTAVKLSSAAGAEAVTTGRIRDGAVTTAKIADANVTDAKLNTSGVTAGTYPKVTVTNKGRVTAGSSLVSSDMPMPMSLQPAANSTNAFAVLNAAGTISVLTVDTTGTLTTARQGLTVLSVIDTTGHFVVKKSDNATNVFAVDASPARATVSGESVLSGALTVAYRGISAARTLDATDHVVNCTANTFTVTLPTAVSATGRTYRIKNSGTGTITIACNGSQTIDGATTKSLATQYSSISVVSNGANWIVV